MFDVKSKQELKDMIERGITAVDIETDLNEERSHEKSMFTKLKSSWTEIERGIAICTYEPRGQKYYSCLEGFQLNQKYRYQAIKDAVGVFYVMYPTEYEPDSGVFEHYYERCSVRTFKKCFKISEVLVS
jgi:hypothetical protein